MVDKEETGNGGGITWQQVKASIREAASTIGEKGSHPKTLQPPEGPKGETPSLESLEELINNTTPPISGSKGHDRLKPRKGQHG